ncbi:hypothetical protein TBLA_0J00110 [Henningerozyma blattae CBS 6284]|uniref:Glycogen debranching enzyme n=1 Tax=Henningerozyma blattae (strain ATCC 34711 / CBS 6284 / DSM 70876 / NBRC 10599 / NRRL Y-10934 / UCD 77-7) TaxID=1071380 RepID=I2H9G0_HENB6|nr:hypothetical protein TBLA_0J00110 [Tetrapisispora blattae CBS 6284]CCH63012.1 hypothetical protein TBLA_0J00110 [Tetrapisispora blattae CBS 6284]
MDLNRTLLLRLSDKGEPVTSNSYGQGVLTVPSLPPPPSDTPKGTPLFVVKLLISAGSPIARDGLVWTNCPPESTVEFERYTFYKHIIKTSFHKDDTIDLKIYKPGPYCFYLSFRNDAEELETTRRFYFIVPPSLTINGKFLQLNSIAMQSVISKWLGNDINKDWNKIFQTISDKKYNMIHFTPLQSRGESNSPYSIYDQLLFDPTHFNSLDDVIKMVNNLHENYNMLSLTDIVFNHTANNSDWLRDHPDSGYNADTAPHLTAAIELDKALLDFSQNLGNLGYPVEINTNDDLLKILDGIKIHVLGTLKLWEFYVVDVEQTINNVKSNWSKYDAQELIKDDTLDIHELQKDKNLSNFTIYLKKHATMENFGKLGKRNSNQFDIAKLIGILKKLYGNDLNDEILNSTRKIFNDINLPFYKEYDDDINEIMEQLYNRINYLKLDSNGLRQGPITLEKPLTEPYFTRFVATDGKEYALANNGWIWNGNPMVDFASSDSKAYLRREVIVWGDCVKLRYGKSPKDSPYLWERITKYVEMNAKIFDGFRIDNCHSTPLHVGEYFLDVARKVNPNLYVVAELFTGSESLDCFFVERLGISTLIREAMQAWSEEELSRLVHKHGGRPIGSFKYLPMDNMAYSPDLPIDEEYCTISKDNNYPRCVSEIMIPKILTSAPPHALFMDCTHDNETPFQKRTVEDTLPNAALVSLCSSAIGSVYGYDEIYPYLLNLVTETRNYLPNETNGIGKIKTILNNIREEINEESFDTEDSEMFVHHEGQYITFHRTNVKKGSGWYLIARTKFYNGQGQKLAPIVLSQSTCKLLHAFTLEKVGDAIKDEKFLRGIPTILRELKDFKVTYDDESHSSTITMPEDFPQGSIAIFRTQQNKVEESLDHFVRTGAMKATENVTLDSLNSLLYRCEAEEMDSSDGKEGAYDIPNFGKLKYCGLQGWITILKPIVFNNDLAHPLSENLRNGHWALDYTSERLNYYIDQPGIKESQEWLRGRFQRIKELPSYLVPSYFSLVVGVFYEACRFRAMQMFTKNIGNSTLFVQSLALTSVQMVSQMKYTSILPKENVPCMAAGLPHFSTGYMRCWGRDVFISLRGLLLTTGRYEEAKSHILAFAKTLKHGLIPNLLDAGRNPRYNARDAAWFFLQAIQDYVHIAPNGSDILKEKVTRRFPLDDTYIKLDDPRAFSYSTSIEDIIFEILQRHAKGIKYREANAGHQIDRVMTDKGFDVEVNVDWETGLVHGGSQFNCGTWMDKMGESSKAGSVGIPGTPRDGAAVEINGLLKSTLRFVIELHKEGKFQYSKVKKNDGSEISFQNWNDLLQNNFEKKFYVPIESKDDAKFDVDPNIVNRRGMYKDLFRSGKPYEDYQLRPNFAIAMTVAPELFTPEYALNAINLADKVIRGPVGMRTLDPNDYNYRPYYNNGEDSDNFATSKGRNYHQGPEWVWCYGYFLRAFHHFNFMANPLSRNTEKDKPTSYLYQQLYNRLIEHRKWLRTSPWAGLAELTNKDGEICNDSSSTQAWSSGCLLDLFYDLYDRYE